MQGFRRQTMQHQAIARTQRRQRHKGMTIVDERQMLLPAHQAGRIKCNRLVELQRVGSADAWACQSWGRFRTGTFQRTD